MSGALHSPCRSAFSVLLAEQTLLFFVDQARTQLWSRWEGCSGDGEPKNVSHPSCDHAKTIGAHETKYQVRMPSIPLLKIRSRIVGNSELGRWQLQIRVCP